MESKEIKIVKDSGGVRLLYWDGIGIDGSWSYIVRGCSEMTKELKVAALLEGRWVDSKITVRFRRGGKTSQDL